MQLKCMSSQLFPKLLELYIVLYTLEIENLEAKYDAFNMHKKVKIIVDKKDKLKAGPEYVK